MNDVTINIIDHFAAYSPLRQQWTDLHQQMAFRSPFLSWEWLAAWSQVCINTDRQLFILTLHYKNNLIGIAPLYLHNKKKWLISATEIRFLGSPDAGSDYLDVLISKGHEKRVAQAIYHYLQTQARDRWDTITLTDIRPDSLFLLHFMNAFESAGKFIDISRSAFCPVLKLPPSADALYAMLSPAWRKKYKQDVRVLNRDYQIEYQVYRGSQAADHLDDFFHHYRSATSWSGDNVRKILAAYIREHTADPPLQLDYLLIDDKLKAALLHMTDGRTLFMYLMVVDKNFNPKISVGNVLVGQTIIEAMPAHYRCYDFLKGHEPYKFHWADSGITTLCLRTGKNSLAGYLSGVELFSRKLYKSLFR